MSVLRICVCWKTAHWSSNSVRGKEIIRHDYLEGDEEFKEIFVKGSLVPHSTQYPEMKLLVCPKCGTVLAPWIAMKTEESEE